MADHSTRVRAVLFDLAGTLVRMDVFQDHDARVASELARHIGLGAAQSGEVEAALRATSRKVAEAFEGRDFYLYRELFATRYQHAAEHLGVNIDARQAAALSDGWWQGCVDHYRRLGSGHGLRTGALALLERLRAEGIRLAVVSNMDEAPMQDILAVDAVAERFKIRLSSEQARSCKPHRRIFERALAELGCMASEAVFVGDTPGHDIDGAAPLGMRTVLILGEGERGAPSPARAFKPDHVIGELAELEALVLAVD